MATVAEFSLAGLSDLDQARYLAVAELAFVEACKWNLSISDRLRYKEMRARTITNTTPAGITGAVTSATTIGDDFGYTTPTETQMALAAAQYLKAVRIDQLSEMASAVELMDSSLAQFAQGAAQTFDYHAAAAAIVATNILYAGSSTVIGDVAAGDLLTFGDAREIHARMTANAAPKVFVPPYGECYLAFVHPHVAYDLKNASSTPIFEGALNVNTPQYQGNVLGFVGGFLWIETSAASLLIADGGAGTVDAYHSVFMGADALGMIEVPVAPNPVCNDIPLNVMMDKAGNAMGSSMIARVSYPQGHLGIVKEVGTICNFGFAIAHQESIYRAVSCSGLANNS